MPKRLAGLAVIFVFCGVTHGEGKHASTQTAIPTATAETQHLGRLAASKTSREFTEVLRRQALTSETLGTLRAAIESSTPFYCDAKGNPHNTHREAVHFIKSRSQEERQLYFAQVSVSAELDLKNAVNAGRSDALSDLSYRYPLTEASGRALLRLIRNSMDSADWLQAWLYAQVFLNDFGVDGVPESTRPAIQALLEWSGGSVPGAIVASDLPKGWVEGKFLSVGGQKRDLELALQAYREVMPSTSLHDELRLHLFAENPSSFAPLRRALRFGVVPDLKAFFDREIDSPNPSRNKLTTRKIFPVFSAFSNYPRNLFDDIRCDLVDLPFLQEMHTEGVRLGWAALSLDAKSPKVRVAAILRAAMIEEDKFLSEFVRISGLLGAEERDLESAAKEATGLQRAAILLALSKRKVLTAEDRLELFDALVKIALNEQFQLNVQHVQSNTSMLNQLFRQEDKLSPKTTELLFESLRKGDLPYEGILRIALQQSSAHIAPQLNSFLLDTSLSASLRAGRMESYPQLVSGEILKELLARYPKEEGAVKVAIIKLAGTLTHDPRKQLEFLFGTFPIGGTHCDYLNYFDRLTQGNKLEGISIPPGILREIVVAHDEHAMSCGRVRYAPWVIALAQQNPVERDKLKPVLKEVIEKSPSNLEAVEVLVHLFPGEKEAVMLPLKNNVGNPLHPSSLEQDVALLRIEPNDDAWMSAIERGLTDPERSKSQIFSFLKTMRGREKPVPESLSPILVRYVDRMSKTSTPKEYSEAQGLQSFLSEHQTIDESLLTSIANAVLSCPPQVNDQPRFAEILAPTLSAQAGVSPQALAAVKSVLQGPVQNNMVRGMILNGIHEKKWSAEELEKLSILIPSILNLLKTERDLLTRNYAWEVLGMIGANHPDVRQAAENALLSEQFMSVRDREILSVVSVLTKGPISNAQAEALVKAVESRPGLALDHAQKSIAQVACGNSALIRKWLTSSDPRMRIELLQQFAKNAEGIPDDGIHEFLIDSYHHEVDGNVKDAYRKVFFKLPQRYRPQVFDHLRRGILAGMSSWWLDAGEVYPGDAALLDLSRVQIVQSPTSKDRPASVRGVSIRLDLAREPAFYLGTSLLRNPKEAGAAIQSWSKEDRAMIQARLLDLLSMVRGDDRSTFLKLSEYLKDQS